ncbi:OmpH family outer membrane protein [Jejudonia soesokkakensis]|uniref:OmpH family outer membrane protein n=1 Tax=Jejudonia soesokkakensis TaxID=1323432 RepID=A0ABW2MQI0_9FLAO
MKFLKTLVLFICVSGFAQSKVGTVDIDYILSKMPELSTVQKNVEAYGVQLDESLNKRLSDYNSLIEAYKKDEKSYTPIQKKAKQDTIMAYENEITKFQQNGTKLLALKREEELGPLYTKIGSSLEKVASVQGYTQILQVTETVVYIDPNYDVTLAVLKDLGITVKEEE